MRRTSSYFTHSERSLRDAIEEISNQLCPTAEGNFDFLVHSSIVDESVDKLSMLINFVVESARRNMSALQEQNYKLSEIDKAKSAFIANISHELRTPLALVIGPVEKLLQTQGLTAMQVRDLETVLSNARILLKHVNDLLDVAKLESGQMQARKCNVDIAKVLRLIVSNFEDMARQKSIKLVVKGPAELNAHVDGEMLQSMIINLLSNAFKFVPPGGVVECGFEAIQNKLLISVSDSGPGVPEELKGKIFERFQQGELAVNRALGGTGLGLAIVKEFVELHNGKIWVEPSNLGGADFRIELPWDKKISGEKTEALPLAPQISNQILVETFHSEPSRAVIKQNGARQSGQHGTILVVEDNTVMRRFMVESLEDEYTVLEARDGNEALAMLEKSAPDLILSDVMMPGRTGDEILSEIRARKEFDDIPMIMLTAKQDNSFKIQLLKSGAQDYLSKPFSIEELKIRVSNQVKMKRTRDVLKSSIASQEMDLETLAKQVTQHREKLDKANRYKDEFLAMLSHELRTPLTAIMGWSSLLNAKDVATDANINGLAVINRNANSMLSLVDELLDLSKISTGKIQLEFEPVNLETLAKQTLDSFAPIAQEKGLQLALDSNVVNPIVKGDPKRLQQVLSNLLTNALKYTSPPGKIELKLENAGLTLLLTLKDSGQGIEPRFLPHVFSRFAQEDGSTTRRHAGLGIGLSVVRSLVELHGGLVSADSAGKGQGSVFKVSLPNLNDPAQHPKF